MMETIIKEIETKNVLTKSNLPVGDYSVNPYVGCTHACKYCYADFMKRFTHHPEPWGDFLDVKIWPEIKNPQKYEPFMPEGHAHYSTKDPISFYDPNVELY